MYACPSTGPPANRVTLQELMRRYKLTDEQLNSKIKSSNISSLATSFKDMEFYLSAMELSPDEQADVTMLRHSQGTLEAIINCLKIWRRRDPSRATYRALLDIVLRLGKGETADNICGQLTLCKYMCISAPRPFPLTS